MLDGPDDEVRCDTLTGDPFERKPGLAWLGKIATADAL